MSDLERQLEGPGNEDRVRLLGGVDPEPEVLSKKIEELEIRLAEKEEKLLEKDLIYEEVTRLADRTKRRAESGKTDTLELAKKVGINWQTLLPFRMFQYDCFSSSVLFYSGGDLLLFAFVTF